MGSRIRINVDSLPSSSDKEIKGVVDGLSNCDTSFKIENRVKSDRNEISPDHSLENNNKRSFEEDLVEKQRQNDFSRAKHVSSGQSVDSSIMGSLLMEGSSSSSSFIPLSQTSSSPHNEEMESITDGTSILSSQASSTPAAVLTRDQKNPISALQELCVQHGLGLPTYTEAGMMGPPHARLFRMRASAAGFTAEGSGLTKKAAKTEAAKDCLYLIRQDYSRKIADGMSAVETLTSPNTGHVTMATSIPPLADKVAYSMMIRSEPSPLQSPIKRGINFESPSTISPMIETSNCSSPLTIISDGTTTLASLIASVSLDDPSLDQEIVQKLYALCGRNGFSFPEYAEIKSEGASHCPRFTVGVQIQSLNLKAEGVGKSKIAAKRIAATNMMNKIREVLPHVCDIAKAKIITNNEEDINRRLKYRIPDDKFENPIIVFELFRLLETSALHEFELAVEAKRIGSPDFDFFEVLSSICSKLNIALQSYENDCIKDKQLTHESIVILTFKEVPILTSYGTSTINKDVSLNQASFRAIVSLYASKNPIT